MISPALLGELAKTKGTITRKLSPEHATQCKLEKIHLDGKSFRWMLNEDQMATEKLSYGIRLFVADTVKLEKYISQKLQAS